ncbi:MFS multidrug transporter-like protein [Xylariomycetidae sp. FL2044]|nr:MFS multidrug transporter-like protein [Xylariomycetidae sp. FL2044]
MYYGSVRTETPQATWVTMDVSKMESDAGLQHPPPQQHAQSPPNTARMNQSDLNFDLELMETGRLPSQTAPGHQQQVYLTGMKFWMVTFSLALIFFLATMEAYIVTTSIVAITADIGGFDSSSWILSSYQLGYVGVIVILSKLSDLSGRKPVACSCVFMFIAFSAGCGAAQTATQLIVLRAFQGVGGGGCFALAAIILMELVPPEKYANYVSNMNISVALSLILGPILGGSIASNTTWRWVFLINVPLGAASLGLLLIGMPWSFPNGHTVTRDRPSAKETFQRLDLLGSGLLLAATLSLTAGFQEAGGRFAWRSAYVIVLLVASLVLWVGLCLWERRVTLTDGAREPILPWRFFVDRVQVGIFLGFLLVGGSMTVTVFQLPQRFQIINGLSAFDASIRIFPFGLSFPVGGVMCARIASKFRLPPIFLILFGAALQLIGFTLLYTLPGTTAILPQTYGYQFVAGFGCGASYQCLYLMIPFVAEKRDQPVALGAANQLRMMGGAIVLSIATAIFSNYTKSSLEELGISTSQLAAGQGHYMHTLPEDTQEAARQVLSGGYNRQMVCLAAFAALQLLTMFLLWKKKQVVIL